LPVSADQNINSLIFKSQKILKEDEAFKISASYKGKGIISLQWDLSEGVYLYKDKISIKSDVEVTIKDLPPGKLKYDEFFGESEVYFNQVSANLIYDVNKLTSFIITFQGCSIKGYCYPLIRKELKLQENTIEINKIELKIS
tara:strand:- start:27837 stop:28262 length:426 start_codon:yes stop_codon:yes gene_type:complete